MKLAWQSTSPTQTKPTRLSLSLACAIALGAMMIVPERAEADDLVWYGNSARFQWQGSDVVCTSDCTFARVVQTPDSGGGAKMKLPNAKIGLFDLVSSSKQSLGWRNTELQNSQITTVNATGPFKVEFKTSGGNSGSGNNSTLTTINNRAERLNLRADDSAKLTVTTLNQDTSGDSQIFRNVSVDTFNLNSGKSYQMGWHYNNAHYQRWGIPPRDK